MTRIGVLTDIIPRPAVEAARADPRRVIRRQVISHPIALVGGAPQRLRLRLNCESDAVANAGCDQRQRPACRGEAEHRGPAFLVAVGSSGLRRVAAAAALAQHPSRHVRRRTDAHEQGAIVRRYCQIPRRMAALGKLRHDDLGSTGRSDATVVGIPHDAGRLGDIDEARVGGGPERNPERLLQPRGKHRAGSGTAVAAMRTPNADTAGAGFRQENVAIGRSSHGARHIEPGGPNFGVETGRDVRHGVFRPRNDVRSPAGRGRHRRGRKVGRRDVAHHAGCVGAPIAVGRITSPDSLRHDGHGKQQQRQG